MKDRTDPTNRDTVPAMLTPGEFVVNKEATQMYADQLKAMNNNGLALRAKRNSMPGVPPAEGGVPQFNEGGEAKGNWWTNLVGSADYYKEKDKEQKQKWKESLETGVPMYSGREMMSFLPVVGDAIAAEEVYNELRKPNPNWLLVGALGGATIVGAIPGVGDAAAALIRKGAKLGLDGIKAVPRIRPRPYDPSRMGMNDAVYFQSENVGRRDFHPAFNEKTGKYEGGVSMEDRQAFMDHRANIATKELQKELEENPVFKEKLNNWLAAEERNKRYAGMGIPGTNKFGTHRPTAGEAGTTRHWTGFPGLLTKEKFKGRPMEATGKSGFGKGPMIFTTNKSYNFDNQFGATDKGFIPRNQVPDHMKSLDKNMMKYEIDIDEKGIGSYKLDSDGNQIPIINYDTAGNELSNIPISQSSAYNVTYDAAAPNIHPGYMDPGTMLQEIPVPTQAINRLERVWPPNPDDWDTFWKNNYNTGGLVSFLKDKEGFKDKAYQDSGGVWTIGYGRTFNDDGSKVKAGDTTTAKKESSWLSSRAKEEYDAVKKFSDDEGYGWNQDQLEAFASFRYNVGPKGFEQLAHKNKGQPGFKDIPKNPGYDIRYNRSTKEMIDKMPLYKNVDGKEVKGLVARRAAEVDLAGPVPYDKRYQGWKVPTTPESNNWMSNMLKAIGKGEAMKGAMIPGYNNGGIPMEDDDIMNFIKTYQGKLGDVNPEDVSDGIISDEELLQNSSNAGANSFMEANQMQYGDPRQSMPMPGAFMGNITDAQSLRGGVVRPDMMPPGYVPPAPEVIPRSTSPQGGMDRIAMANLKQAELDTPFPTTQMLDTQMFKDSLRPEAINAPAIPKKQPFWDTSYAYNRDGEEIILDQEGGNKENITIPVTKSKFAEQADAIRVNQAELEKAEAERLLRLATTEKARLDAIKRIEAAQKKLDEAKGVVQDNVTARENLNTIEDRNTLRNAELELASLRKEKANATNQLHIDQLDKLIAEKESLLKDVKTELGIDETNDNEIKKKTEVLKSRVPIPRNLEEAAESGEVEKAGSKVKQGSPQWESAKNFLKDIFGDIFNKKDLVRAITIYLGARIFGASGNQAGAMAGKYYLGKQDAHEATVAAYAKSGKYTSDSVALYSKTRNLADLVAIGKPVTPTGEFKMYYGVTKDGNTVRVNAQKFRMGEGSYVWKRKTKDGWVSFDVENYTADGSSNPNFDRDAYDERLDRLYKRALDLTKASFTYKDEDDKEQDYFKKLKPEFAAQDLAKWAIDNDVDLGTASEALQLAINMAKQAERKTGDTSDLTPFLNQAYIVTETNPSGESAVAFKNLDGEYIPYGDLKKAIVNVSTVASNTNPNIADMNPVLRETAIIKIANGLYRQYATARATDGAPDIYADAAKNNKTTPLYEFMRAFTYTK